MTAAVDLTNLRTMTDGDEKMEKELFEEFYNSFEGGIVVLKAHLADAAAEEWRTGAHALKGISLNLGAARLSAFCKKAQDEYRIERAAKEALLRSIEAEYEIVKAFLRRVY